MLRIGCGTNARLAGGLRASLVIVLTAAIAGAVALADEIGVDDRRVSDVGGLGNADYDAAIPRVAYNSIEHEYLVVWAADDIDSGLVDGEIEIFGQILDATTGDEVGAIDFLISHMGGIGTPDDVAWDPRVAFNSVENEYLVVWRGTEDDSGTVLGEWEVYVQRLDGATGDPIGSNQRISAMGGIGALNGFSVSGVAVAYDPERNQYLVAWSGSHNQGGQLAGELEIFVQRLDGATAAEIGVDDQRVSEMGGLGNATLDARGPAVVFNPTHDEFLVVWYGDEAELFQADDELEIFAQRLEAVTGTEVGSDDFRVSFAGANLDPDYDALDPAVAYDPVTDQYFIVWSGDDDVLPLVNDEFEIWGQLLDGATGDLVGSASRLSDMGPVGSALHGAFRPRVVWSSSDQEYLVVWDGDDDPPGDDEFEIFLQRVGGDGIERGLDDERLSSMGPDGSPEFEAWGPALAFNPSQAEALVVWVGDDDTPPLVDDEHEIYAQRWIQSDLFADDFESGDDSRWSSAFP